MERLKKQWTAKQWLCGFALGTGVIVVLLCVAAYVVDPFFQFRVRDNSYFIGAYNAAPGLIRHYDYDTLVLGSSMTQNFRMDTFRRELGGKPLHIGLGGMNTAEERELYALAKEAGRASRYYLCVDLHLFTHEEEEESKLRDCLMKEDVLSRLGYFLDYEAWFRFIPVDAALALVKKSGMAFPEKLVYRTSVDRFNDCSLDFTYGREQVLAAYQSPSGGVSAVTAENLEAVMKKNLERFLHDFDSRDGEIVFFFPPYSALYWIYAQDSGFFDAYMEAREHFVKLACEKGFTVYDFQETEWICDLDLYKDITHYNADVNDRMTVSFADGTCRCTPDNAQERQQALKELLVRFRKEYPELFAPR